MTAPAESDTTDAGSAGQGARAAAPGPIPPRPLARRSRGLDAAGGIALALSAVWLLGMAAMMLFLPPGDAAGVSGIAWVAVLVAIVMPVALIWVAALTARTARIMREESARLRAAVDAVRHAAAEASPVAGAGRRPPVEAKLDEIARAQRQTEAAIARLTAAAAAGGQVPGQTPGQAVSGAAGGGGGPGRKPLLPPGRGLRPAPDAAQPSLALPTPDDATDEPIPNAEFVRALNFPEDEGDAEGFRALRLALKDRRSAALIRSAQDMLTLLSEDGIYMDDLAPDRARPEVWRRFAQGERGKGVAALGGVRDRSCLALASGRMRQDPIFRDTAHHFLRKFDRAIAAFEPDATDAEIVALAETRTARAFMLLGRVSGTFD